MMEHKYLFPVDPGLCPVCGSCCHSDAIFTFVSAKILIQC